MLLSVFAQSDVDFSDDDDDESKGKDKEKDSKGKDAKSEKKEKKEEKVANRSPDPRVVIFFNVFWCRKLVESAVATPQVPFPSQKRRKLLPPSRTAAVR